MLLLPYLWTRYYVGTQMYISCLLTCRGWHWHLCACQSQCFLFLPSLVCISRHLVISVLTLWACCPQVPRLSHFHTHTPTPSFVLHYSFSWTTIPSHSRYLSYTTVTSTLWKSVVDVSSYNTTEDQDMTKVRHLYSNTIEIV